MTPNSSNNSESTPEPPNQIINILPSYHMDQSTRSKSLYSVDYSNSEPPSYLFSPASSASEGSSYFDPLPTPVPAPAPPITDYADPTVVTTSWKDSILANTDKLKVLSKHSNNVSKDLKLKIFLTEEVGKKGVKPKLIDPAKVLLWQNQYLYGFVTIRNESNKTIPFDMFCVTFEGELSLDEGKPTAFTDKFLNMFDFNASWCDGTLDRFPEDNNNPHLPLNDENDPYDNTIIQLNPKKLILPGVTYKKFFAFKIPEKLLDCGCSLIKHLQIPPTFGKSINETLSEFKSKNEGENIKVERGPNPPDFSFTNSSINYSICARIIGRSKDYEFTSTNPDQIVIGSQTSQYMKVCPYEHQLFELNRKMMEEEAILNHVNRVHKIEGFIQSYKSLGTSPSIEQLQKAKGEISDLNKLKHSYYQTFNPPSRKQTYEVFCPYKTKKSILQTKIKGLLTLSTPKTSYPVTLDPHINIKELIPTLKSQVIIPLKLSYISKSLDPEPVVKNIDVELIALTIKSKNMPIPCIFYPDMVFENSSKPNDDFDHITIKRFQIYAKELSKILQEDERVLDEVDNNMIRDIKVISNLRSSSTALNIKSKNTLAGEWIKETETEKDDKYTKEFALTVNIADVRGNGQSIRLVPEFQSCYKSRLYYLRISVNVVNNDSLIMKVPIIYHHR